MLAHSSLHHVWTTSCGSNVMHTPAQKLSFVSRRLAQNPILLAMDVHACNYQMLPQNSSSKAVCRPKVFLFLLLRLPCTSELHNCASASKTLRSLKPHPPGLAWRLLKLIIKHIRSLNARFVMPRYVEGSLICCVFMSTVAETEDSQVWLNPPGISQHTGMPGGI